MLSRPNSLFERTSYEFDTLLLVAHEHTIQ